MSPLDEVLNHQHGAWCKPWSCADVVWLADDRALRELDRASLAAGRLIATAKTIRRDAAGPRPTDTPGRYRPWLVSWARRDRPTTPGAGDATQQVRAGVELVRHGTHQAALPGFEMPAPSPRPHPLKGGRQ